MPTITDCITLQSRTTTIAYPTGDRDYTAAEFDAPSASLSSRGVLMFRVVPTVGDGSVRLKLTLNGTVVSDITYRSDMGRTWHEIFEGNRQPAPDDPYLASRVTFWENNGQIGRQIRI